MASLKEYNNKILTLQNTKKVTNAMKMIATTKYQKYLNVFNTASEYHNSYLSMMQKIVKNGRSEVSQFFDSQSKNDNVLVVLFTSDKGLCGSHNSNASKAAISLISDLKSKNKSVSLSFVGKRGRIKLGQERVSFVEIYEEISKGPFLDHSLKVSKGIIDDFLSGKYSEVWLVYNKYLTPVVQIPVKEQFLPLTSDSFKSELSENSTSSDIDYIFEPDRKSLLNSVIPDYLCFRFYYILLTSYVSEFCARMTAMDAATNNCKYMIDNYSLLRNRARQSAITTELNEIVSGKEAL